MTTAQKITLGLVGIGGYGGTYLSQIFAEAEELGIELVGTVDPIPAQSSHLAQLQAAKIPIYATLEEFYTHHQADLLVIASPIQHHMPQTRLALQHGSHVLCEKPLSATIQDGLKTLDQMQTSKRFVAIGYNWSFSPSIQALKADILAGEFGRALRLKSLVLWHRWVPYYTRNRWAGRIHSDDGAWILDSPVNNATAHYLHNLFYLLGDAPHTSAQPVDVQAELYRANAIENYDTAALRAHTAQGTEILFYTAHPVAENQGPHFVLEFEKAILQYNGPGHDIMAHFQDGRIQSYPDPHPTAHSHKLRCCVENVRQGTPPLCDVVAATAHTRCMNGAQESAPILPFPQSLVHEEDNRGWVEGLGAVMVDCYQQACLPGEKGVSWAQKGAVIDLRHYDHFPQPHAQLES